MRIAAAAATLALSFAAPPAAHAQPAPAAPCTARAANLGGIGRAMIVAFTSPVLGSRVCAVVANIAIDGFSARIADAPASDALVSAAVTGGGGVTLPLEGATLTGVGPYVVAPGGIFPNFSGDISEAPRVVFAYAGQRVLVIGTTDIALVDLARVLRTEPDLFGADAVERAVVIASGPAAALTLNSADGPFGAAVLAAPRVLLLIKRG